jgi:tRNA-binding EMAP/Myf-like protein
MTGKKSSVMTCCPSEEKEKSEKETEYLRNGASDDLLFPLGPFSFVSINSEFSKRKKTANKSKL